MLQNDRYVLQNKSTDILTPDCIPTLQAMHGFWSVYILGGELTSGVLSEIDCG